MLDRRLNLTVTAYGFDPAPEPGATAGVAGPARLRGSGTALVASIDADPANLGQTARTEPRYQVLRIDRNGFTRLNRRFDAATGTWQADERRGPGGSVTYRRRWDNTTAVFPAAEDNDGRLLVRAEDGGFAFIHSSIMEYLVAAAAAGVTPSAPLRSRLAVGSWRCLRAEIEATGPTRRV